MSKFVFIRAFAGKKKDTQKPFNVVTIVGIDDEGVARSYDLFTQGGAVLPNQDKLRFGDVVKPSYKESEIPGGRPWLVGLEVVQTSPYFGNI